VGDAVEATSCGRSGLPVPRRRTFASGILPFAHSEETFAAQSLLRSVSYAGSRARATPTLRTVFEVLGEVLGAPGYQFAWCSLRL
jgi:hypothetical protein